MSQNATSPSQVPSRTDRRHARCPGSDQGQRAEPRGLPRRPPRRLLGRRPLRGGPPPQRRGPDRRLPAPVGVLGRSGASKLWIITEAVGRRRASGSNNDPFSIGVLMDVDGPGI